MPIQSLDRVEPRLGSGVFLAPTAYLVGDVEVGNDSSFWFNTTARGDVNFIRIGARTSIQDSTVLHVTHETHPLIVGDDVVVGHAAVLHGCVIEDGALIGIGARVLDGAVVEAGAQVAAGAVVTPGTRVPAGQLALGLPARVARQLSPEEAATIRAIAARYVRLKDRYLATMKRARRHGYEELSAVAQGSTEPGEMKVTGKLRTVKGTRDLLPPETAVWQAVEETVRRVFGAYGYHEIRTPLLEDEELFVRSVGESTDIVGKEMYAFSDKKGRRLCLRPENTAPVARAFIQHALRERPKPVKLFYLGPQFRYERPQKGRYRQFHQIGAELIGDAGPLSDAELLLMLVRFLGELGFDDLTVLLNTLGDSSSRARYRQALTDYFEPHRAQLSVDSQRRLETNPLRILDTKVRAEQELVAGAPSLSASLNDASRRHFAAVEGHLDSFGVDFRVEPALVRGLDYYTSTVFEIVASGLGAHSAIVGGGRYDRLIADLGGEEVPAIGFAIGQDRLIEVLPEAFRQSSLGKRPVMVVPADATAEPAALKISEGLRDSGLEVLMEVSGRSVKAALKQAHRGGVRFVVLLGADELASGRPTVRDMQAGEQFSLPVEELAERLREFDRQPGEDS